ncbi:MAG: DNA repair protein RecO [Chitinispirillia bacterium]|nr:DNA repair protein RecO [Chitinispirillia bacterium]
MSAEKTESVILSVSPFRETSCVLRLFTRTRGLVHGMAKGVRSGGKSSVPVDRGFLLESQLYYKPNRDMHTLGSLHVINFFPGIRSDIIKSAVRDIALELYLKSITQSEPHPELFELIAAFFAEVEESPPSKSPYPRLWRFIFSYCRLAGFGIGEEAEGVNGIDSAVIKSVNGIGGADFDELFSRPKGECIRVTEVLLQYCRRHFDIRAQFNSLEFLRSLR